MTLTFDHLIQRVNNGIEQRITSVVAEDECDKYLEKYFGADPATEDFNVAFKHRCYYVVMDMLPCCGYENDNGGLCQFC